MEKVTLANMRGLGVRTLRAYCSNAPRCWHAATIDAEQWSDDTAILDIEPLFVCTACGAVGAELRPDWVQLQGGVVYPYG